MNVLHVVSVILNVIALLLYILEIALPYWFWSDATGTNRPYYGLWELCASVNYDDYVCRSFAAASVTIEDWMDANIALQILALCFATFALIAGISAFFCGNKGVLLLIAGITAVCAAVCCIIGVIIFGVKFQDGNNMDGSNLHASWYLALFAAVFALVAGIFYFIAKPMYPTKEYF